MEDNLKEETALIEKLLEKGYKAGKGKKLADDPDFGKLCKELVECRKRLVENYKSHKEFVDKYKGLAVAYCIATDFSSVLD